MLEEEHGIVSYPDLVVDINIDMKNIVAFDWFLDTLALFATTKHIPVTGECLIIIHRDNVQAIGLQQLPNINVSAYLH